ncbi:gas vesicle protein [Dactylosporangium roseum]|uniref:Gas vesicle protein n=1 Tax=Dactylosporangium roseum TaxID=47989 RepID=A0ABY5YZL2_9ACTN|nr:gas vesicle protein [Dactylosporangium roseum]UWZ33993.1 gas vesicle protein [Dactylosporangium roseum]
MHPDGHDRERARRPRRDESYDEDREDREGRESRRSISAASAARMAIEDARELTGKEPIGAVSVEPANGGWTIGVEMVEERRVPSTADMLGLYLVQLSAGGELLSCRRDRRYLRGSTDVAKAS